jgi:hypothetical protein
MCELEFEEMIGLNDLPLHEKSSFALTRYLRMTFCREDIRAVFDESGKFNIYFDQDEVPAEAMQEAASSWFLGWTIEPPSFDPIEDVPEEKFQEIMEKE